MVAARRVSLTAMVHWSRSAVVIQGEVCRHLQSKPVMDTTAVAEKSVGSRHILALELVLADERVAFGRYSGTAESCQVDEDDAVVPTEGEVRLGLFLTPDP